jgi:hypothetical protein
MDLLIVHSNSKLAQHVRVEQQLKSNPSSFNLLRH